MNATKAMESASCPRCAQTAGEYCAEWINGVGMQEQPGLVHPERLIFAAMKASAAPGDAPSEESFDRAVLRTGLV